MKLPFKTTDIKPKILVAANIIYAGPIQQVLAKAFEPFREIYTAQAFEATVLTQQIIKQRIESKDITVFYAKANKEIVGTASIKVQNGNELFLFSMAVLPKYAGRGIGALLLMAIEREAMAKNCEFIALEAYAPLKSALSLYDRFGFKKTGKARDNCGIEVFEMRKKTV